MNSSVTHWGVILACVATGSLAQQAPATIPSAGSQLSVSLGLKVHPNRISSNAPRPFMTASGPALASDEFRTSSETSVIPILSARYRDFFASTSYLAKTDYSATQPSTGLPYNFERDEFDVNVGYYVLPSLALTLGYKQVETKADFGSLGTVDRKDRGPTLGVAAAAPVGSGFGVYGNLAIGRLTSKVNLSGSLPKNDYISTEMGLFYTALSRETGWPRSLNVTLGYRYQSLDSTGEVTVSSVGSDFVVTRQYNVRTRDTSRGPVLGVIATF